MRRQRLLATLLVVAMLATMFTGCSTKKSGTSNTNDSTESASTTETGTGNASTSAYPGTSDANSITVNLGAEPPQLFTVTTQDTISGDIIRSVIENLVTLDANDQVQPGVATDWKVSDDGLTYTFNLRKDMKWSNGEPVTAKDFVFAWTSLLTPDFAAPYAYFGYMLKNGQAFNEGKATADQIGVKATDDYTLEVTLENPIPYFLSTLAFPVFAPLNEKAYNEFGDTYGTDADKMVYNGAYTITSWEHNNQLVMEKNPNYYDAANVGVDKITCLMITDANAALNAFKAGEADIVGVNGDQTKMMQGENYPVSTYDDGSCFYLLYNMTDKYLANKNLRTALTYAVDKQAYVDSIVKDSSKAATSFTPPAINGTDGKFQTQVGDLVPVLDVAKAKEFYAKALQELGTDKVEISMICDDTDAAMNTAAFIQEQLKTNLGIDLKIESMPFKSRIERMNNKDFSMVFAGWGPDYNDPMTFLDMFETGGGNNNGSYTNPAYDELLAKIRKEVDPATRMGYLVECEKTLMSDLPIGPIYWRSRNYITSGKIASGVVRSAFQDYNFKYIKLAK